MTIRRRGRYVFDRLVVKELEGGPWGQVGVVYHVNIASALYPGSDDNEGLDYEHPLLTITEAQDRCVSGRNDFILIWDYWQASGETWPIVVNKRNVHICGVAHSNLPYPAIHPTGDTPSFVLGSAGQYSEMAYLTIGGGDSHGGINLTYDGTTQQGQVDGMWLHNLLFGHRWFGTPQNGILQRADANRGGNGNRIEDCVFLGDAQGKGVISGNGIDLLQTNILTLSYYQTQIVNNTFHGLAIGINAVRDNGGEFLDNRFTVPDSVTGEAITLGTSSLGTMVNGNEAMNGMLNAGYTYNPFRDLAANTANHWGRNYRGNAVIEPVGV